MPQYLDRSQRRIGGTMQNYHGWLIAGEAYLLSEYKFPTVSQVIESA
jgi:hypothetical protein